MDMEIELFLEGINGKRQHGGGELDANVHVKKGKTATAEEQNAAVEKMAAWLMMDQDAVVELEDLLDSSEQSAASLKKPVKFADDPYSSMVVFQSSAEYVTINGNEAMCGSSFSDMDSSVMASIDTGGVVGRFSGKLDFDGGDSRWLDGGRDFVEGIFAKSLSACGLFDTPPPQHNANDGGGGGGGGEEEMWMDFVDMDLLGDSW